MIKRPWDGVEVGEREKKIERKKKRGILGERADEKERKVWEVWSRVGMDINVQNEQISSLTSYRLKGHLKTNKQENNNL